MSKQQNDLVTKQDVEEAYLFTKPNVEEAKKILISVQDQDIEAVYKVALPSRIQQELIVALPSRIQQELIAALPSRIQQELNDQNIKANAVYKIVSLPSRILQKFNAKTSDAKKILTNAEKIKILTNAEKILTKELSDLKTSYATNEEQYNIIDSKSQELNNLCTKLATEKEELEQVQKCLNLIHAMNNINISIKQILNMSDVSYRIIEKLHLDEDTPISEVVQQLENLLSTFDAPLLDNDPVSDNDLVSDSDPVSNSDPVSDSDLVSENDSDYTSSDDDLSTSKIQYAVLLRDILSENNPQHPVLLKIKELADEFSREIELGNTEYINNNDDVSVAGGDVEHNDTL